MSACSSTQPARKRDHGRGFLTAEGVGILKAVMRAYRTPNKFCMYGEKMKLLKKWGVFPMLLKMRPPNSYLT